MIWFTGDTHFGDRAILKYTPFETMDDHDEKIIRNWNSLVKKDDKVFHLGDLGRLNPSRMRETLYRLHGQLFMIMGDHDREYLPRGVLSRFEWVKDFHVLKVWDNPRSTRVPPERVISLFHYKMAVWALSQQGGVHLHAHSHGKLPPTGRTYDVGCMCNGSYNPVSITKIYTELGIRINITPTQMESSR